MSSDKTKNTPVEIQTESESELSRLGARLPAEQYTEAVSYDVPRPFLTLQQAAAVLGKSIRSLERSLLGRWGNKLPDGWLARKVRTEVGDEWRILPPPGFRVRQQGLVGTESDTAVAEYASLDDYVTQPHDPPAPLKRRQPWRPERHTLDQPAIVIDRSEEVEHLMRDMINVQRALAEERRLHMEDLRMITQLQSSMRLLEVNHNEQSRVKAELESTRDELNQLKAQYNSLRNAPWWKRLFGGSSTV